MHLKIDVPRRLLDVNCLMCLLLFWVIVGKDFTNLLDICSLSDPYLYGTICIFFLNIDTYTKHLSKFMYRHVWNLGLNLSYTTLVYLQRNYTNCDALVTKSDILATIFFIALAVYNPFPILIEILLKKRAQHVLRKYSCTCRNRRLIRKTTTISVHSAPELSTYGYYRSTNSASLQTDYEDNFVSVIGGEMQTITENSTLLPPADSAGNQDLEQQNSLGTISKKSNASLNVHVSNSTCKLESKVVTSLPPADYAGNEDVKQRDSLGTISNKSNSSMNVHVSNSTRQFKSKVITLLPPPDYVTNQHVQRQNSLGTISKRSNSSITSRTIGTDVAKIEDLIEAGNRSLDMVPTKEVIVPTEVPRDVAIAIRSIILYSESLQHVKSNFQSTIKTRQGS